LRAFVSLPANGHVTLLHGFAVALGGGGHQSSSREESGVMGAQVSVFLGIAPAFLIGREALGPRNFIAVHPFRPDHIACPRKVERP
jgi:hypothetical protein